MINYMSISDTAAPILDLDVVTTMDAVVAHLAGDLGKLTWILLPYSSDFRWFKEMTVTA